MASASPAQAVKLLVNQISFSGTEDDVEAWIRKVEEARKWNFPKESFQNYTLQKMKLINNLQMPEHDRIQLTHGSISPETNPEMALVVNQ
ncbi:hypothetical protein ALC56_07132 [Trachymyrmex septentrionalis]|uniref:Uncharacterized protein n=1 Tax=Trachymyrmex septentrionalis TaxID=34720 RepID=A0A151JW34_9HYME|nr:hypothetical protein ALC56_07132 [Trachymyrmex septentrionalis]